MRERALAEMEGADLVVLVHDPSGGEAPMSLSREADLVVHSKSDLRTLESGLGTHLSVSARTGSGMGELRKRLDESAFAGPAGGGSGLALNARHVRALEAARDALVRASGAIGAGAEVVAMELRAALEALGSVVGQVSPDDLLGRIFSQFCIGK